METLLIKNGRYYDINHSCYKCADILIEGGIIAKIAEKIPYEGLQINATGTLIFPGFIDAHSHIGMWQTRAGGNDANECTDPITPTMRAIDGFNSEDKALYEALSEGFTTAMITPGSGNVIGGQAAIVKLWGKTRQQMVVDEYAAFKIALGENPKSVYGSMQKSPASRMAIFAMLDSAFTKARLYMDKKQTTSLIDNNLEPYIPVLKGETPLKIHVHRIDDIKSAIRFANKYQLSYTLDHCTEGIKLEDKLDAPVLIGPIKIFKSKYELKNATDSTAKMMIDRGFTVSLISDHPFCNIKHLRSLVGLLVKEGLTFCEAVKMLTINPARALKIDDKLGSIEVGKQADLIIFNDDPFEIRTHVLFTLVAGEIAFKEISTCY